MKTIGLHSQYDATFACVVPNYGRTKPYITFYGNVTDETLIHEMVHYYLYLKYLPEYLASKQRLTEDRIFIRRFGHTKEFWKIFNEKMFLNE